MRVFSSAAFALAAIVLLPRSTPAQGASDRPAPGFGLAPTQYPASATFGATATLSDGGFVVFDGLELARYASDGSLVKALPVSVSFVFPSFVLLDASESVVYFGESSNGTIQRAFLDLSSPPDALGTLAFNYDAALSATELFVSAATCGFGCGNEIWSIDLVGGGTRLIARTTGASGPVALDPAGNLYYARAAAAFPPPPKPTAVYRWSAAQVAGPSALDLGDAQLLGGAFEGAGDLAFDGRTGALYLVENNFASGANRIRRVLGSSSVSPVVVEGRPFRSIASLSLVTGSGAAQLRPFQPASDALISYTTSDFFAPPERYELRATRATLAFEGDGVDGPGAFELVLAGGPPLGFARILFAPLGAVLPSERVLMVGGVPLFLAFAAGQQASVASLARVGADGALRLSYSNPGGLEGNWALQLLLFDAELRLVGSSAAAPFQ
jgi:hypothetical protein